MWFLPRLWALLLTASVVVVALAVEWARVEIRWFRYFFLSLTRRLLRWRERRGLTGATYMAIGYFAVAVLFPRSIAVTAMLYDALGDSGASLVGNRFGRHRAPWGKSWEGAAAGLAINVAIGLAIPGISVPAALTGAVVAATLEFLPLPLDDNLRVTLGGGLALWVTGSVALA